MIRNDPDASRQGWRKVHRKNNKGLDRVIRVTPTRLNILVAPDRRGQYPNVMQMESLNIANL
jgi:hypothetical protein